MFAVRVRKSDEIVQPSKALEKQSNIHDIVCDAISMSLVALYKTNRFHLIPLLLSSQSFKKMSKLHIVHWNDVYHVIPKGDIHPLLQFCTALRRIRTRDTLSLFSGDAFGGSRKSTMTEGKVMVRPELHRSSLITSTLIQIYRSTS